MKKILNYFPLISALLLFIGYLNYVTYYNLFDIDITSFLTTGELLLSFLPLTSAILFILFLVLVILVVALIGPSKKSNEEPDNNRIEKNYFLFSFFALSDSIKSVKTIFKEKKWKTLGQKATLIFEFILAIIGLTVIFFFVTFFIIMVGLVIDHKPFPNWDFWIVFSLSVFWFFILFEIIKRREDNKTLRFVNEFYLGLFTIAFLYFTTISNKKDATDTLSGKPHFKTKLIFSDSSKNIESDSNLVFVGKTAEYYFFRNLKKKTNHIYSADGVINVEVSKVEYPDN